MQHEESHDCPLCIGKMPNAKTLAAFKEIDEGKATKYSLAKFNQFMKDIKRSPQKSGH